MIEEHGVITPEYIDYCRHDVRATWELWQKLRAEYERHPIALQATKAYSPASIGKAYLRAMNVRVPELRCAPDVQLSPAAVFGAAMQSYFGGRSECRIRRQPVPVV